MNHLEVKIPLSEKISQTIIQSIGLEAKSEDYERSKVKITYVDGILFTIEASDLSALRASVNSHLRWIDTTIKLIKEKK